MKQLFSTNKNTIYLIPTQLNPIKIRHNNPCPVNQNIWCEYSVISCKGMDIAIECKYGVQL